MTLWAVETACTEPGDRVRHWFFSPQAHAAESASFLESWTPAVWH